MKETLAEMTNRAALRHCYLDVEYYVDVEFSIQQGAGQPAEEGYTESGSFKATYRPYPKIEAPVGWGGTGNLNTPDTLTITDIARGEGLPGMTKTDFDVDFDVVEYDMSDFETVDYNVNLDTQSFIKNLDEQLSEAVSNIFTADEIAELGEIKFAEVEDDSFDAVAKEIADEVDRLALESLTDNCETLTAFDKSKPADID